MAEAAFGQIYRDFTLSCNRRKKDREGHLAVEGSTVVGEPLNPATKAFRVTDLLHLLSLLRHDRHYQEK